MKYEILDAQGAVINTIVADASFVEARHPGRHRLVVEAPVVIADPAAWLIDVGPFFDRFGAAKINILASANATVQALVRDLQIRKWVDLQRADVAAGIDALIALGVPGVDGALKTAVLTTPVRPDENEALRKVYFS